MIIFGTRGLTTTRDRGSFHCPECGTNQPYALKARRPFFHIYWIPLIPIGSAEPFIECRSCRSLFRESVLQATAEVEGLQNAYVQAIERVLYHMIIADGQILESELEAAQRIYTQFTGTSLTQEQIELGLASTDEATLFHDLAQLAPALNENGKETAVKVAAMISIADGNLAEEEIEFLRRLAQAVGMSELHFRGVLASLEDAAAGGE